MSEEIVSDSTTTLQPKTKFVFRYLPDYARFVRDNHIVPYIQEQIRLSRLNKLPMLRFFENISDADLITMGIESHREFLTAAENNTLEALLDKSLKLWVADGLGIIKRDEIAAEDITLASHIRKGALMKFLPSYTTDVEETISIIKEIDIYSVESDTAATNIYISLLRERRQQLLDQLQLRDKLFKQAQAQTHIGNWTWNIPEDRVTWSDEMYRIYGLEPQSEQVSYETYLSHIHPDDKELRMKQVQHVFETGIPEETHYRIVAPDGSIRILHTISEIEFDQDRKPLRMSGTCQDITDKQNLIDRLQRSETLYKQAQAISHMGNWTWEFATKKIQWSDEVYHIYELEPQSVYSSDDLDKYNHPDDRELIAESIRQAVKTHEPFDFHYRIVLKSGRVKTLHARGEVEYGLNSTFNIYGTLQDITEQKIAEKQIKDYKEFIEKIMDVTPSIIAAYNINTGAYSFVNEAIEKILGYPTRKLMESGVAFISSLIHPDDVAGLTEKNTKAIEEANQLGANDNEPIIEFKYRLQHANGEYRWFHTYGTVFERNDAGLVESVLNISVDITDQENAEQELFQKNLMLQQSNTSLEEYAYVASHDLKEPLRKIATFSDRILTTQQHTLNEEGKVFLSKIIESSRRMQKMIGDLLSVSTILGNKTYEPCDLNIILAEALQPLDHKIEEIKAKIDVGELPTIQVVPAQFRQLFQNLISNSLKFARAGIPSEIKITHSFVNSKVAEKYKLPKAKKYLQIQLQDNGIGFKAEYADKIFAIFQRLHGKNEYDGTGIGLAVCKKIIENHDGVITATGEVDKGAIFTIIIPA